MQAKTIFSNLQFGYSFFIMAPIVRIPNEIVSKDNSELTLIIIFNL